MTRDELTEQLVQIGKDEMAAAVAELLATAAGEDEQYRAGVEDALNTMIQAGATTTPE